MSATGRSLVRDPADYYATPAWCVHRLLEHVDLPGGDWLEPSAGNGAIISAVNAVRQDVTWTALEYRPECLHPLHDLNLWSVQIGSFTTLDLPLRSEHFDVVIGNPPYRSALRFVQRAMELSPIVVMLLRLNWLAPETRAPWLREHIPSVYVLPNRPSFVGRGGDATEYAWMVWQFPESRSGQIQVLATTPRSERKASIARSRGQLVLPVGEDVPACNKQLPECP